VNLGAEEVVGGNRVVDVALLGAALALCVVPCFLSPGVRGLRRLE
jgi:hypothetical protein